MPNEDLVLEAFHELISTGIVEFWQRKALEIKGAQIEEGTGKELSHSDHFGDSPVEVQELKLDNLLVLEIFTLYGAGICTTLLAFICCKLPTWWEGRKRNRVAIEKMRRAGSFKNKFRSVERYKEIKGLCSHCRNAIQEHFALATTSAAQKPIR